MSFLNLWLCFKNFIIVFLQKHNDVFKFHNDAFCKKQ